MVSIAAYLFLVSLIVALIATPIAVRLGLRWGVVDHPGPRKIHQIRMPLSGGWAIFTTLTVVTWGHLAIAVLLVESDLASALPGRAPYYLSQATLLASKVALPFAGAVAIFLLGLFDDCRRISVKSRLVVQIFISAILVMLGLRPSLGFLPEWMGALVSIVWMVGIMNAFNFIDGLDGLSAGTALVATTALSTIMAIGNQPNVAFLIAVIGGALLGFLRYNYHPAKLFLGSAGSLLIGYLMAVATILATFIPTDGGNWLAPLFIPVFILAIPIYDTTSVVFLRLLKRKSVAIGDQRHFHHRLLKLGYSHRQTVLFIWLIAFAIALSAVRLANATLFQSALILVQIGAIFSILVMAERAANKARKDALTRRRRRTETPNAETMLQDDKKPSDIVPIR